MSEIGSATPPEAATFKVKNTPPVQTPTIATEHETPVHIPQQENQASTAQTENEGSAPNIPFPSPETTLAQPTIPNSTIKNLFTEKLIGSSVTKEFPTEGNDENSLTNFLTESETTHYKAQYEDMKKQLHIKETELNNARTYLEQYLSQVPDITIQQTYTKMKEVSEKYQRNIPLQILLYLIIALYRGSTMLVNEVKKAA